MSAIFLLAGDGEPPDLRVDGVGLAVPPRFLHEWRDLPPVGPPGTPCPPGILRLWRYDFAVPFGPQVSSASYGFEGDGRRWAFSIPGDTQAPLLAYVSNAPHAQDTQAQWSQLLDQHQGKPVHLLLQGGGQIDTRDLWSRVPALRPLAATASTKRQFLASGPELEAQLDAWYIASYLSSWSPTAPALMQASVASLCMWDDMDIVSGWDPAAMANSPTNQAIYRTARRAFRLFQIGMGDDDPADTLLAAAPPSFSQGLVVGDIGVVALDLCSERTANRVLSPRTEAALPDWLELFSNCQHLLLLSSAPLIFPADAVKTTSCNARFWRSKTYRDEWQLLLRTVIGVARRTQVKITLLSGRVPVAFGLLTAPGTRLRLLASTAAKYPNGRLDAFMRQRAASRREVLFDRLVLSMEALGEGGGRLPNQPGYLTLTDGEGGALQATWHGLEQPPLQTLVS